MDVVLPRRLIEIPRRRSPNVGVREAKMIKPYFQSADEEQLAKLLDAPMLEDVRK